MDFLEPQYTVISQPSLYPLFFPVSESIFSQDMLFVKRTHTYSGGGVHWVATL